MKTKQVDSVTRSIERLLTKEHQSRHPHAEIKVYRYNPAAIRIRIVDPDFKGKSREQRDEEIWRLLEKLPEDARLDITICLLLTPEEQARSLMNLEFEEPLPSGF